MAEERNDGQEISWQRLMPWTLLFRTFQVTLDLNKLALAAGGILATALAWSVLGFLFTINMKDIPPRTTTPRVGRTSAPPGRTGTSCTRLSG